MEAQVLITELIELTQSNMNEVEEFKKLDNASLNRRVDNESWSILECMEHVNRYGDFYIPEIKRCIENSNYEKSEVFKSGILGNYFAKSMLPKEKLNKMKTFTSMNPINSDLDRDVLDKFMRHQEILLDLLNKARASNLTKIKTAISISKWMKLRLGDTFRIVIYHNWRHVVQAKKLVEK